MLRLLRHRRYRVLGLVLLGLLAGGAIFLAIQPSSAPRAARLYPHLERGMTSAEVEAVLGGPPGDHRATPRTRATSIPRPLGQRAPEWVYDDGSIIVYIDGDDRCVRASLITLHVRPWHLRLLDRVAGWF